MVGLCAFALLNPLAFPQLHPLAPVSNAALPITQLSNQLKVIFFLALHQSNSLSHLRDKKTCVKGGSVSRIA